MKKFKCILSIVLVIALSYICVPSKSVAKTVETIENQKDTNEVKSSVSANDENMLIHPKYNCDPKMLIPGNANIDPKFLLKYIPQTLNNE